MFNKAKTYGFIPEPRRPADWQFGAISGIDNDEVLREDGQWDSYIPSYEPQRNVYFDTMACVSFSALNCIETLLYRKYGEQTNFSDRALAKMSGTTTEGNSLWNVAETIRKKGFLYESDWPFLGFLKDRDGYYSDIHPELLAAAEANLKRYSISYEFVWDTPDKLVEALKFAPVQVAFHAYCPLQEGIHARCAGTGNHAVMLYGYVLGQYWKIYDHYDNKFKKVAWDTAFYGAVKFDISNAEKPMPQFKPNTLYQVVEGPGEFILNIAGKMRRDDLTKLLASWAVVNGGKTDGQVGTLTLKDLEGTTLYDLKGNKV